MAVSQAKLPYGGRISAGNDNEGLGMTSKLGRGKPFQSRKQITNSFNTSILTLALPLLLAACGGGGGGVSGDSSPAVAVGPSGATTSNSATLAWDPPATATNLSGYRVYYGTAPGTYLQPPGQGISVGNITTYTLMGLSNATRYYIAVTAFDTSGNESAYSNEAFKDIP